MLGIDNYRYMSFNDSFMLLITSVSLLIFPPKKRHQPVPGSSRKRRNSQITMADDEWKNQRGAGMEDGRERLNSYRKTEGHQVEDHNSSPSSLKFQGIRGCSL